CRRPHRTPGTHSGARPGRRLERHGLRLRARPRGGAVRSGVRRGGLRRRRHRVGELHRRVAASAQVRGPGPGGAGGCGPRRAAGVSAGSDERPGEQQDATPEPGGERVTPGGSPALLVSALRVSALRPVLVAIFAVTFAFVGMEATYALLGERLYGLGPAGLGM